MSLKCCSFASCSYFSGETKFRWETVAAKQFRGWVFGLRFNILADEASAAFLVVDPLVSRYSMGITAFPQQHLLHWFSSHKRWKQLHRESKRARERSSNVKHFLRLSLPVRKVRGASEAVWQSDKHDVWSGSSHMSQRCSQIHHPQLLGFFY